MPPQAGVRTARSYAQGDYSSMQFPFTFAAASKRGHVFLHVSASVGGDRDPRLQQLIPGTTATQRRGQGDLVATKLTLKYTDYMARTRRVLPLQGGS